MHSVNGHWGIRNAAEVLRKNNVGLDNRETLSQDAQNGIQQGRREFDDWKRTLAVRCREAND